MELQECFLSRVSSRLGIEGRNTKRLNQPGVMLTKEEVKALLSLT